MANHSIDGKTADFDRRLQPLNVGTTNANPIRDAGTYNVPQVLVGYYPDGWGTGKNYGIKVSKPTVDVRTATDINTVMSSAYRNFKIVAYGSFSITKSSSTTTGSQSVAHNLGYTPAVHAYASAGIYYWPITYAEVNTTTGITDLLLQVKVDATNVTGEVTTPSAGARYASGLLIPVTYYLYIETAT